MEELMLQVMVVSRYSSQWEPAEFFNDIMVESNKGVATLAFLLLNGHKNLNP